MSFGEAIAPVQASLIHVIVRVRSLFMDGGALAIPDDTILLPEDLKDVLQQQCDRLSEIEKQVLSLLAKESEPINLAKLLENGTMPASDLLNVLQSLSRRCLIQQQGSFYALPQVVKQYIKEMM